MREAELQEKQYFIKNEEMKSYKMGVVFKCFVGVIHKIILILIFIASSSTFYGNLGKKLEYKNFKSSLDRLSKPFLINDRKAFFI